MSQETSHPEILKHSGTWCIYKNPDVNQAQGTGMRLVRDVNEKLK